MSRRTRVLQIAWRYSKGGGKTQVARDLLAHHNRDVVDMHAFSMRPLYDEDALGELGEGITFHSAGVSQHRGRTGALRGIPPLTHVIRRLQPDIVHVHAGWDWWVVPALMRRRLPLVVEVHDPPSTGKATRKHAHFLRVLVSRFGAYPLTHSTWARGETARWLRLPTAEVRLVPLGVDLSQAAPAPQERIEARVRLGLPRTSPVISYVARLVPSKRPELFVDVAREVLRTHTAATFVLVGTGPLDDAVAARASALGERFRQLGYVPSVRDVLAASDLYCSTSAYEGFGLAVADAMAAAVVPVAAETGGLTDVIGSAGVIVREGDAPSLAAAVRALIDDETGRARLASAAERRVRERFDVRTFVQDTETVWLELVERAGPASCV